MNTTDTIVHLIHYTVLAGTPFVLVALGELVTEKSGVLNLGAEGIMSVAAVAAFAATYYSNSTILGVIVGMSAGIAITALFAVATLTFMSNQVASGLALTVFGQGLASFVGKHCETLVLSVVKPEKSIYFVNIPIFSHLFLEYHWMVYLSWFFTIAVSWFLYCSKSGLILRAIGESPSSAHAIGYNVIKIRYQAVFFGGAMAGLGGAVIPIFMDHMWAEGMVSGRGWISIALVVFATWRPLRVLGGAYLFGGCMYMQTYFQTNAANFNIPPMLLAAFPFLVTILILVLISRNRNKIAINSVSSLGQSFFLDR